MRKWMLAAAVCLLAPLLMGPVEQKAGGNLVKNGDFAKGLEAWTTTFPGTNETKYAKNHEAVSVADAPGAPAGAKALKFSLSKSVAESQGVKVVTPLLAVGAVPSCEFGAEVMVRGPSVILFAEGYRADPSQKESGNDQYPGYVRCWRATIFPKCGPGVWSPQARTVNLAKLPERNRPTHILVKLYAYGAAGEVFFRHIFLRNVGGAAGAGPKP